MSFSALLNRTCNIENNVPERDTYGQEVASWQVVGAGLRCRLDPIGGDVHQSQTTQFSKATHKLFLRKPSSLAIRVKDFRIDVGGDKYDILHVGQHDGQRFAHHIEILLELIP